MTKSLPGTPGLYPGAKRGSKRLQSTFSAVGREVGLKAGAKVIPWIPNSTKRMLSGGRAVVIDGNTLDPTLQLTLAAMRMAGIDGLNAGDDVTTSREQMRMTVGFPGPQIHVGIDDLVIPGPAGDIPARYYSPVNTPFDTPFEGGSGHLLVFYHGGGWVLGDLDTHDMLCRLTCRDAGIHVLSIDYRLAPEHRAPAAVEDAYAAYKWAHDHAAELGASPGRIAVGGDSAGGNLAAVVSQLARDEGFPAPMLQWLIYPRTDFTARTRSMSLFARGFLLTKRDMDWFNAQYLTDSGIDPADPRLSPLRAESLSGLPPALIALAGFDPLRDEGESYAEALRAAENAVDLRCMGSLTHGFASLFPLGGGSAAATGELISALRAHLSRV
jgi:acetyl esterase